MPPYLIPVIADPEAVLLLILLTLVSGSVGNSAAESLPLFCLVTDADCTVGQMAQKVLPSVNPILRQFPTGVSLQLAWAPVAMSTCKANSPSSQDSR